jgi:hypothetical protein
MQSRSPTKSYQFWSQFHPISPQCQVSRTVRLIGGAHVSGQFKEKGKKRKGYNVPRLNGPKGDQGRTLILASWAEFGPIRSALFSLSLSLTRPRHCRPGADRRDPPVGLSKGSGVAGSIPSGSVSCGHACVCPALVRHERR